MNRIHVVGCPRSGTSLALELIVNGFHVDDYAAEERTGFRRPRGRPAVYVSKMPHEVAYARTLLRLDPTLHLVHLVRDPRDVVVSRHGQQPDRYWAHLRMWRLFQRVARAAADDPRFVQVRYESLVREPARTQEMLQRRLPFLCKKADFADFYHHARPSQEFLEAMGPLRPLDTSGIGAWRDHKPRLVAQLERHGPVSDDLVELGYEPDDGWLRELDGVAGDFTASRWREEARPPWGWARLRRRAIQAVRTVQLAADVWLLRRA